MNVGEPSERVVTRPTSPGGTTTRALVKKNKAKATAANAGRLLSPAVLACEKGC